MSLVRDPGPAGRTREEIEIRAATAISQLMDVGNVDCGVQAYLDSSSEVIAKAFRSPLVLVRIGGRGDRVESMWRDERQQTDQWLWIARAVSVEAVQSADPCGRLIHADGGGVRIVAVAAPLRDREFDVVGSVCLFAQVYSESVEPLLLDQLAILAAALSSAVPDKGDLDQQPGAQEPSLPGATSLGAAGSFNTATEYAFRLAATLRERTRSALVAVAVSNGSRVELLAVSDVDSLDVQNTGTDSLRQAMAESLDLGSVVISQDRATAFEGSDVHTHSVLNTRWRRDVGAAAVMSMPIPSPHGNPILLGFVQSDGGGFTPDQVREILAAATTVGRSIAVLRRAERGLAEHARDRLREILRGRGSLRARAKMSCWALLGVAALWLLFGTARHEIVVPAALAPRQVIHLTAPFEGRIAEAYGSEGAMVAAGALLCRFETADLELSKAQLIVDARGVELEAQQAIATGDRVLGELLHTRLEGIQHRLSVLDRRIGSATLRAPVAGRILRGDLSHRVGQVVPLGETLFEYQPTERMATRLELQVPQAYASEVQVGASVLFSCRARPGHTLTYVVDRIRPAAEAIDGQTVFVVLAELDDSAKSPPWLRVGMEGAAGVDLGRQVAWRVVFDRVYRFAHSEWWL